MSGEKILIVDDEEDVCNVLKPSDLNSDRFPNLLKEFLKKLKWGRHG